MNPFASLESWLFALTHEIWLAWRFIRYDISSTIMPAMFFLVAALRYVNASLSMIVAYGLRGLVYFSLYILVFCMSNQLTSVDEDRLNKPDRPLPAGLVTFEGALWRWSVAMLLFSISGWLFGVVLWVFVWQASLILNNLTPLGKHWLMKHLNITLGTLAMMAAAWEIVTPITPLAWDWIVITAILVFPLITVQDLRDMAGDKAIGRKTLPIVLGEKTTRILIGAAFAIAPVITHLFLIMPASFNIVALICEGGLSGTCLLIAVRTLFMRSKAADHRTYQTFTYWYCFLLATAILIF